MFFGLTPLGTFHTAISLIAVIAGFVALIRYKEIATSTWAGKLFLAGTIVSCLTGFGIFQHGGFGKPHALGIVSRATSRPSATRRRSFCTSSPRPPRPIFGTFFVLYLVGATLQVLRLRKVRLAVPELEVSK
jgi:hypothetical protein